MSREGIRKIGNAPDVTTGIPGIVTSTVTPQGDLLHILPLGTTCKIVKICAYNPGAAVNLLFGTKDLTVPVPLFVQLLPDLRALGGLDNEWTELELPAVEFAPLVLPAALGRTGNIWVVAGTVVAPVAGVIITIEVEELR